MKSAAVKKLPSPNFVSTRRLVRGQVPGLAQFSRGCPALFSRGLTTDKHVHDNRLVEPLLAQVSGKVRQVTADGNYDFQAARLPIRARGATDLIPPRADAVIVPDWPRPGRDQALKLIARWGGRAAWKRHIGYHQRSLIETAFSPMKGRLGPR